MRQYFGVDFSGAKLAGRNTWIARLEPTGSSPPLRLVELRRLESIARSAKRAAALERLVRLVAETQNAVWAFDFPFGLPVEVMPAGCDWPGQLDFLTEWGDDAYGMGLECVRRAKLLGGPMHIRRLTDIEEAAPFDCYHYRIIYQTFFGMRDVLGPLRLDAGTAVAPFQYARLGGATRVVVEGCAASTLRRLGLPRWNYKQPAGGPLTYKRRTTRRAIVAGLLARCAIGETHRLSIMRNPGGDALDAVVVAVGGWLAWASANHAAIGRHERYVREGKKFVG